MEDGYIISEVNCKYDNLESVILQSDFLSHNDRYLCHNSSIILRYDVYCKVHEN